MDQKHAVVTNDMLEKVRSRIGKVWTPSEPFFNTQATRDTIRHFCNGIGDVNPLYRKEEYARKSRYGHLIAPPCFLYSVYWPTGNAGSLAGVHGWHSGNDWTWYRPILVGDEISYSVSLLSIEEKPSKMAGRSFITTDETTFKNQKGEVVAKAKGWAVRAERGASGEKKKYWNRPKAEYTPEKIQKIYADYDNEVIRGAAPRYWEDVKAGDELTPVVKGPLSLRDIIAWTMGGGSPYIKAHGIFLAYQKRHPAVGMLDTRTGQIDVPELVHMETTRAQEIGIPVAYDYGPQRLSWLGQLITNWMGDDGFLKKFRAELRGFNMIGDTTWCRGKVVKKYVENNEHLVECEVWAENQNGDITAPGSAIVVLPTKKS